MEANTAKIAEQKSPSSLNILLRELVRDKLALVSLIFLILITAFVFGISLFLDPG